MCAPKLQAHQTAPWGFQHIRHLHCPTCLHMYILLYIFEKVPKKFKNRFFENTLLIRFYIYYFARIISENSNFNILHERLCPILFGLLAYQFFEISILESSLPILHPKLRCTKWIASLKPGKLPISCFFSKLLGSLRITLETDKLKQNSSVYNLMIFCS